MRLIEDLNKKELSELLGKCWMTHDGMWFYHCFLELGIERTNKLNKAAIHSLSTLEIKRFKKAMGIKADRIESYEEFKNIFTSITNILIPEFMNVTLDFPGNNIVHWRFNEKKCFAYNGMKMLGVVDKYECGVIYRVECWLAGLGIRYEVSPKIVTCVSPDEGRCSGDFRLYFN
jgi:hypothetical protein